MFRRKSCSRDMLGFHSWSVWYRYRNGGGQYRDCRLCGLREED